MSLVKRIIFLLFCESQRSSQRALRDLTCSFGSLVPTIDEAYQCMAVKAAVRCLLLTANADDNKHQLKAYRCLKQAHRRRIEDIPIPSPTQMRLNACQLQVCMINYSRFNAQHTQSDQPAADRGRPGLWRHLLAHSG